MECLSVQVVRACVRACVRVCVSANGICVLVRVSASRVCVLGMFTNSIIVSDSPFDQIPGGPVHRRAGQSCTGSKVIFGCGWQFVHGYTIRFGRYDVLLQRPLM